MKSIKGKAAFSLGFNLPLFVVHNVNQLHIVTSKEETNIIEKSNSSNSKYEEENADILLTALPVRPGTDLASKLLLNDPKMKNIIIEEVVGSRINGDVYHISSCDRHDGRKTDILYLPNCKPTNDLPPVIVEIQQKVDHLFLARAMRYCLDVFEETHIVPILVVFNIKGFSSKQIC